MSKELEADEQLYPVSGNRRYYSGFYDRAAGHGAITGSGPGYDEAMSKFRERQKQWGLPGVWRTGHNRVNKGTQRDVCAYVMEWI